MQAIPVTEKKKKKKSDEKEWPHYQFVRLISLDGVELFDYPDSKGKGYYFQIDISHLWITRTNWYFQLHQMYFHYEVKTTHSTAVLIPKRRKYIGYVR